MVMQPFMLIGGANLEDRAIVPDAPGGSGALSPSVAYAIEWLGVTPEYINDHNNNPLTYSAVWACVRYISNQIGSFSWNLMERTNGGSEQVELDDPIAWLLEMQANPEVSAFEFRRTAQAESLIRGNSYAEIETDGFGRVQWMWRIAENRVCPDRDSAGNLVYEIDNGSGVKNTVLPPSRIFHLKGLGSDGIVGYSVVEMARRSIRLGLQMERFGDTFARRGPMPGGVLEVPGAMKQEQRDSQRKEFERVYGGAGNAGRVIVLSGGNKFTPLSISNKDAEFLESRKFSAEEIARWYGVPPHKIGLLDRSTNNNIEHQGREAVQDCLMPHGKAWETEANIKLFGRVNRGRRFTKLDYSSLQRGDTVSQTTALSTQVNTGMRTPNEARKELGLNPMPNGNDLLVQGAMISLDTAINPPEPVAPNPAPAAGKPAKPGQQDEPMPEEMAAAFGRLLIEAYDRLLRVETDKAKRADNKGRLANHIAEFYCDAEQAEFAGILEPIFAAFLTAAQRPVRFSTWLANSAAHRRFVWSQQLLSDGKRLPQTSAEQALIALQFAWENSHE